MSRRVITFGSFDLFHIGHLRLLERAAALGDAMIVGVSSDALSLAKKGVAPIFPQADRLAIVGAVRVVDTVFVEESLEGKAAYIRDHAAELLVMGEDWRGRFDHLCDHCEIRYLPRTPGISTTGLRSLLGS